MDHELESALKIRELKKASSWQPPPLCAKCISSCTEQERSNTTAYKDVLCLFMLFVIIFFLKHIQFAWKAQDFGSVGTGND